MLVAPAISMTRLPGDSFMPSGAIENDFHLSFAGLNGGTTGDSSSSVISPLSLPRGAIQYFDTHPAVSNHLSGMASNSRTSSRGPPQAQPAQFLSPHLTPFASHSQYQLQLQRQQQRSASLSPTHRAVNSNRGSALGRTRSAMLSPSRVLSASTMVPIGEIPGIDLQASNSYPPISASGAHRSVSETHLAVTSQEEKIRRLEMQNAKIKQAWENERKQLQANRDRAEEVYLEERTLMEEERAEWDAERAVLEDEIRNLQEQLLGITNGMSKIRSPRNGMAAGRKVSNGMNAIGTFEAAGMNGAIQNHFRGGWDNSPESVRGSESSQGSGNGRTTQAGALQPSGHGSTRINPLGQPEISPFIPLNQHLTTDSSSFDSMAAPEPKDDTPVPTVDIQEIHPELEGIPIKQTAISKFTFSDKPSSKSSSRTPSPPAADTNSPPTVRAKEQTLKVLAAEPSRRLTMHAGHTPNHSLSVLPSAAETVAGTTASSSGTNTPTLQAAVDGSASDPSAGLDEPVEPRVTKETSEDHPEPLFEPSEDGDRELKGPLTIRNMPAHDEIFFRRLSDKLERVNSGEDAVPTVLKRSIEGIETEASKPDVGAVPANHGGDAAHDSEDKEKDSEKGEKTEAEEEIPLKLKRSNNFGAPFGAFR